MSSLWRGVKDTFRTPWKMGIISIMFYLAFQIFSDILALKQIEVGWLTLSPVFFIYPLTFTFRDMMHKVMGKQVSRIVIVTALVLNFVMLGLFRIYVSTAPAEGSAAVQGAVETVFGSVWRIVLASITAEFISEMVDTEVYQRWVNKFGEKHQWGRVLFSNMIAGPIDIIAFKVVAFAGIWPTAMLFSNLRTEFLFRFVLAAVSIPFIYLVPTPKQQQFKEFLGRA